MTTLSNLMVGFGVALQPENILFCAIGATLGTFIGVVPGIGALSAISMLLPLTFYLDPTTAIIMLAGIFYGAQYGGSTASILLNLPGTATNAVTCLDGYPMAKQGRAGVALFMTTITSFVGGSFSILLLIGLAPAIASFALSFGAREYFAVMLFGLVAASTLSGGSPVKGFAMVAFGVLLGTVGIDPNSGAQRFQFGILELADGLNLVAVAMGLFGVAEILANLMQRTEAPFKVQPVSLRSLIPTKKDVKDSTMPTVRGMIIGAICGVLPGTGPTIASFMAYATEKRVSKHPERFGHGTIEGIASPEAANNSSVQAAFIPTLSLGIPGDAVMAVLLGALMIHGITPGPALVNEHPTLFWGLVASFWVGNFFCLILNFPLIGIWVRMLRIPYHALYPAILFFICLGVYSINYNVFDIYVVIVFGLIGVGMLRLGFPAAPLLLGFILGPMIEENLRRALLLSRGDLSYLGSSPVSLAFLLASLAVVVLSMRGIAAAGIARVGKGRERPAANE